MAKRHCGIPGEDNLVRIAGHSGSFCVGKAQRIGPRTFSGQWSFIDIGAGNAGRSGTDARQQITPTRR
jgi:hypothetical protein